MTKLKHKYHASSLMIALIASGVFLILLMVIVSFSNVLQNQSRRSIAKAQLVSLGNSGLNRAIAKYRSDTRYTGETYSLNTGTVMATVQTALDNPAQQLITARAFVPSQNASPRECRTFQVRIDQVSTDIVPKTYAEFSEPNCGLIGGSASPIPTPTPTPSSASPASPTPTPSPPTPTYLKFCVFDNQAYVDNNQEVPINGSFVYPNQNDNTLKITSIDNRNYLMVGADGCTNPTHINYSVLTEGATFTAEGGAAGQQPGTGAFYYSTFQEWTWAGPSMTIKIYLNPKPITPSPTPTPTPAPGPIKASDSEGNAIVRDGSGNIYITGSYDTNGYPGVQHPSKLFVRKYDSSGKLCDSNNATCQWGDGNPKTGMVTYDPVAERGITYQYTGSLQAIARGMDISIDASGNLFVLGYESVPVYNAPYQWLVIKYTSSGVRDGSFGQPCTGTPQCPSASNRRGVAIYSPKRATGASYDYVTGINGLPKGVALDSGGNVYAAGLVSATWNTYNNGPQYSEVEAIVKWSPTGVACNTVSNCGSFSHSKTYGSLCVVYCVNRYNAVRIDSSDNVYAAGTAAYACRIAKYTSAGVALTGTSRPSDNCEYTDVDIRGANLYAVSTRGDIHKYANLDLSSAQSLFQNTLYYFKGLLAKDNGELYLAGAKAPQAGVGASGWYAARKQSSKDWEIHTTTGNQYNEDVTYDSDGNTYVAGTTDSHMTVRKYDSNGKICDNSSSCKWGDGSPVTGQVRW